MALRCSGNEEWSFCAKSVRDQCPLSSAVANMGGWVDTKDEKQEDQGLQS